MGISMTMNWKLIWQILNEIKVLNNHAILAVSAGQIIKYVIFTTDVATWMGENVYKTMYVCIWHRAWNFALGVREYIFLIILLLPGGLWLPASGTQAERTDQKPDESSQTPMHSLVGKRSQIYSRINKKKRIEWFIGGTIRKVSIRSALQRRFGNRQGT